MNSHSPVGLVSRQRDTVDTACVLCECRIQNDERADQLHHDHVPAHFTALVQAFLANHPGLSAPLQPRLGYSRLLALPKAKIAVEREVICKCDGHTVHKLGQQCVTAE